MQRLLIINLLFILISCQGLQQKEEYSEMISGDKSEPQSDKQEQIPPNEHCRFLFPAGLDKELKSQNLEQDIAIQTNNVCNQMYHNKKAKSSLWINLEKFEDSALLKRTIINLSYMPGYLGLIDAGDGGSLFHEKGTKSEMIRAIFSAGIYKCVLESKIENTGNPSDGILFSEDQIRQLALDWGSQLKQMTP